MTKPMDPDIKALTGAVRALDNSSNPRMLRANQEYLWDRYIGHPSKELPDHLKPVRSSGASSGGQHEPK